MEIKIRRAVHSDASGIINSHRRSIREVCAKDYNSQQIAAWSGRDFKEERWHQTMDKDLVWVISDEENKIFGFGHLMMKDQTEGHVAGLYFVPEVIGLGFGKRLFQLMKEECKQAEIPLMTLGATKTAKTFYQTLGFEEVGATVSKMGDQQIESFNMRMSLV